MAGMTVSMSHWFVGLNIIVCFFQFPVTIRCLEGIYDPFLYLVAFILHFIQPTVG